MDTNNPNNPNDTTKKRTYYIKPKDLEKKRKLENEKRKRK